MKVTIKVPEELINKDSKTKREYYIARSHNGKVDILETKYNEKTNSLTFEKPDCWTKTNRWQACSLYGRSRNRRSGRSW